MDKKTAFLAVLATTSIIIAGDLATQLYSTQRALEIEQQRVEVLEVQARDKEKILEIHDDWFFEYIETGYIEDLQQSVDRFMESGSAAEKTTEKGAE